MTTDDETIASEGRRLGWLVPFMRPAHLASDEATSVDAVLHALDRYVEWSKEEDPQFVMLLQATSPLRSVALLQEALEMMRTDSHFDAVIAVSRIKVGPLHLYSVDEESRLTSLGLSAGASPVLVPNGALYLIRTAVLRHGHTFFPLNLGFIETGTLESIDIDTEEDWLIAEAVARVRGL